MNGRPGEQLPATGTFTRRELELLDLIDMYLLRLQLETMLSQCQPRT